MTNNGELLASRDFGQPHPPQPNRVQTFAGQSVNELWDLAEEPVDWLVGGVFSAEQPTVFGAPKKTLKTTLLTDLVVALATGDEWLGKFEVPRPRKVLFITGESTPRAAIRRIRRAYDARGLSRDGLRDNLRIEAMHVPKLRNAEHQVTIAADITRHGFDVVVLDPLYRAIDGHTNAANLFDIGDLLGSFSHACMPASVILSHHLKASARYAVVPDLDDLSQSGTSEFAGNYFLLGRLSEYAGDKKHSLAFQYGGRDEQYGSGSLDFDEADWRAQFGDLDERLQVDRTERERRDENAKVHTMKNKILRRLKDRPEGLSANQLARRCGTNQDREVFVDAIDDLPNVVEVAGFKSGKHSCIGYRIEHTD